MTWGHFNFWSLKRVVNSATLYLRFPIRQTLISSSATVVVQRAVRGTVYGNEELKEKVKDSYATRLIQQQQPRRRVGLGAIAIVWCECWDSVALSIPALSALKFLGLKVSRAAVANNTAERERASESQTKSINPTSSLMSKVSWRRRRGWRLGCYCAAVAAATGEWRFDVRLKNCQSRDDNGWQCPGAQ